MAVGMGSDCEYMRKALLVQYQRLLDWCELAGILEVEAQDRKVGSILGGKQTLLAAILSEIQTMMDDFALLNGRYEELQASHTNEKDAVDVDIVKEMKALDLTKRTSTTQNRFRRTMAHFKSGAKNAKELAMHPQRLRWITFDGEEFKKLLSRLGEMINYLHELMSDYDRKELLDITKRSNMEVIEVQKGAERIEHLVQALVLLSSLNTSDSGTMGSLRELQHENEQASQRVAQFKALQSAVETQQFEASRTATLLNSSKIKYDYVAADASVQRLDATYEIEGHARHVWIEWKGYSTYLADQRQNIWAMHQSARDHIQRLALLLRKDGKPGEFCTVDCLGYFDDRDIRGKLADPRVGLVYEKPAHCKLEARPTSLLELFDLEGYRKPSLTARIYLAHRIASCLGYLHVVNWLHKGLRSDNIVVLPNETGELDIKTCQFSGFEYARLDVTGKTTRAPPIRAEWEIYRHPDYQGLKPAPARKTFDIYSLGIVLIEIVQWRSIGAIMGKDYETTDLRAIKSVKNELLDTKPEYLEQVRSSAGDRYLGVVQKCLQGSQAFDIEFDDTETSQGSSAKLQRGYIQHVVNELKDMMSRI